MTKEQLREKEELYLLAQDAYYRGEPIMEDPDFDELEEELKAAGSTVVNVVGGPEDDRTLVHKHMSPMLSINKIQVNDEAKFVVTKDLTSPLDELLAWAGGRYPIEGTPKFDGNAIELEYNHGQLVIAITRGKYGKGADVTKSLHHMVPLTIPDKRHLEVRGEVVMPVELFDKKYRKYKNPRNLVAGILKEGDAERAMDCVFVAYSAKVHAHGDYSHVPGAQSFLSSQGFNDAHPVKIFTVKSPENFTTAYYEFKNYRHNECPYQLDGIVFKMHEDIRASVGEGSHHPNWAVAIKFPSREVTTTIVDIEWAVGPSGIVAPTAILETVDMDGADVSRASLYNKTKIEEYGTYPGAVVTIKMSGDIIPQITSIVRRSPREAEFLRTGAHCPSHCPSCASALKFSKPGDTEHVTCENPDCVAKLARRLANGISALDIKGAGDATAEMLVRAGVRTIQDFFDPTIMDETSLIMSGVFKRGRELELLMKCPGKLRKIELDRVVLSLQFPRLGRTISREIAKMVSGAEYSFEGFERAVVEPFLDGESEQSKTLKRFISLLKHGGVVITEPKSRPKGAIAFEMTGSPKPHFDSKEAFVSYAEERGFVHASLSKTSGLLITDDLGSATSKMAKAKKLGVEIISYDEFMNRY